MMMMMAMFEIMVLKPEAWDLTGSGRVMFSFAESKIHIYGVLQQSTNKRLELKAL